MPLTINDKSFVQSDDKTVSDAIVEVQKLPKLPIAHQTKSNPKEAVTVLQRESCFVVDEPEVKLLATVGSMTCMFLVCRGMTLENKAGYFASHVDVTNKYGWDDRLISMRHHPVEVYLVGGEYGSKESEIVLRNILKYLIDLSNKENLNIVFRGQRILADFRQTKAELPEQCRQYIFQKAAIVYRQLFNKPLPLEFGAMNFGIEDPLNYYSKIPKLDSALEAMPAKILAANARDPLVANQFISRELLPFLPHFVAPTGLNFLVFCGFLSAAGGYDATKKASFAMALKDFANDEATFAKNLTQLFCVLGYDAVRFFMVTNGNQQIPMYTQFCFNLEDCSVSPISNRFSEVPFYYQRRGQVISMLEDTHYVEAYAAGAYKKPVLGKLFIALCDRFSPKFKNPGVVLEDAEEKAICSQFGIRSDSSVYKRDLWALLHYYANHRDEFVEQKAAVPPKALAGPTGTMKGGFFKSTPPKKDPAPAKAPKGSALQGGFLKPAVKK